jgi:agmatine deiminase
MKGPLRIPAEWEPHSGCWLAFPYRVDEWPSQLEGAQRAIAELSLAISGPGNEPVRLLVKDEQVEEEARALIGEGVTYVRTDYGDCWVRDTAPLFGHMPDGSLGALQFAFNGWGGKYVIPHDDHLGAWLASHVGATTVRCSLTVEGGAFEFDGKGTVLTTASCVLNPNRNPGVSREAFEDALRARVEVDRLIWLEDGLAHDHTDGHVDMIARFVAHDTVVCMTPTVNAPNVRVLNETAKTLRAHGLTVIELPAAPAVRDKEGTPLPGTYCNFYVANGAVIVPVYGVPEDEQALEVIAGAFPGRETVGLPARDLLCGGGAFHCVTQPQPASP